MLVAPCIRRLCLFLALVSSGNGRFLHSIPDAQQPNLVPMLKNVYRFWLQHGLDEQYGKPICESVAL
jgi:hypothetical protein